MERILLFFYNCRVARRGRKPKKRPLRLNIRTGTLISVLSVSLIFLSLIITISFFSTKALANRVLQETLADLFGFGMLLIPVLLAYAGLFFFSSLKWKILESRVLLGLIIFFLGFEALLSSSGGIAGSFIFNNLSRYLSPAGGFAASLFSIVVAVILIFDLSLDSLILKIKDAGLKISAFGNVSLPFLSKFHGKDSGSELEEPSFKNDLSARDGGSAREKSGSGKESKSSEDKEAQFEIIPTLAEPQGDTDKSVGEGADANPLASKTIANLPYTDDIWEYPPISLLADSEGVKAERGDVKERASVIEKTLESFGIRARVVEVNMGPSVTQYALETVQGTKIAKITSLQNDLALALASPTGTVRIEAPIPGKSLIGIEIPNFTPEFVTLKELILSEKIAKSKSKLVISLGKDVSGRGVFYDIAKMPHVLIAGATGSGKSIMLHSIISTLLFKNSPAECKFIMIDPKRVELIGYRDIPHLLTPVIVDVNKALPSLKWAISEMERRYRLMETAKVRDLAAYNELSGFQALPYIIIVVDEMADLMMTAAVDTERVVCRLAQMARAVGIHLILATQRPSVDVLTGLMKANIPCRVAFNVTSQIDSRVIIDQPGAERLLGKGDMLFVPPDASKPVRIQGVFVSDRERSSLVDFLKQSAIKPDYKKEVTEYVIPKDKTLNIDDPIFKKAVEIVCLNRRASTSFLQRKLSIGYSRAARLMDALEDMGVVSAQVGSKPRNVLINNPEEVLGAEGG